MTSEKFSSFKNELESFDKTNTPEKAPDTQGTSSTVLSEIDQNRAEQPLILIIDDDPSVLELLNFTLQENYELLLCQSGEQGVNEVNADVSAVILDIKMRGKDGFQTFIEIKNKFPHLPIIFHSAYQDLKDPYHIMNEYRPFGYIVKEGNARKLWDTIASAVEFHRQLEKNAQLAEALRVAYAQQNKVIEEDRSRFAEALHNDVLQLVGLMAKEMKTALEKKECPSSAHASQQCLYQQEENRFLEQIHAIDSQIREIMNDLHPRTLKDLGIVPALRAYVRQLTQKTTINLDFQPCAEFEELPFDVKLVVFRIAQEAIANIVKHAKVNQAQLLLGQKEDFLWLQIEDEGKGFDSRSILKQKIPQTHGLFFMRENAKRIGGTLNIHSEINEGTTILLEIPRANK
ncbi:response regulator [Deltaproteobacteria bacterium TL4]